MNGEETLNGRKDGNNSGRSSSRKERFSNLQRTWNFTGYNNPKGNANTERYFRTYKEEVAWVLDNPSYEELVERTKDFENSTTKNIHTVH